MLHRVQYFFKDNKLYYLSIFDLFYILANELILEILTGCFIIFVPVNKDTRRRVVLFKLIHLAKFSRTVFFIYVSVLYIYSRLSVFI